MATTAQVRHFCDVVDGHRKELEKLMEEEATLRMKRGQGEFSVNAAGRRISVTAVQDRTYMPSMVRGMEMVQLGLLKWYAAAIDRQKALLASAEEDVARAAAELAKAKVAA